VECSVLTAAVRCRTATRNATPLRFGVDHAG
jgi:hypothetical protein